MGRTPEYDREATLAKAAGLFGSLGYAGCSVEDLVQGLAVHRGSLYKAFGSKRGLFVEALRHHVERELRALGARLRSSPATAVAVAQSPEVIAAGAEELDLVLVAAMEATGDPDVAQALASALDTLGQACLSGADATPLDRRAAGLTLLSCRLAARCVPASELTHHLQHLAGSIRAKDK